MVCLSVNNRSLQNFYFYVIITYSRYLIIIYLFKKGGYIMKVLYVINNLYSKGNGLCVAVRNNITELKKRGIEIKVLSGPNHYGDEEPFSVQIATTRIAKKMKKPCVATYHLHPENIFSSIKMDRSRFLNAYLMFFWKHLVYNRCKIVHCPTINVEERLKRHKFKAELRTFSNGISYYKLLHVDKEYVKKDIYSIISVGRYAYEKDLKTIIKALKYSKYKDNIKLTLAGRGPTEKSLKRYDKTLYKKHIIKHEVEFGFKNINELQDLAKNADLYIHAAFIEVEGLSCMEAIQIGLVPIIAEGKYTATSQFALNDMSKFKARNAKDLASKIDYWLDDDERRFNEALKYKELNDQYDITKSIDELVNMYEDALK